ncbi:MAG: Eco57I restriction-modification methylase domain-containing protein [Isosphaeraceae bacterium]
MFIYFLQKKGFIDGGDRKYLRNKLDATKTKGKDRYFKSFLKLLFFEGFARPEGKRSAEANAALGSIRYLNGGLFLPHKVEQENPKLNVPDRAFEALFALFDRYSWNLDDTPGGKDDEINPDVLGYIFEKYINQKAFGAYYTRPEITEYLCERTIHQLILDAVNTPEALLAHAPAGLKPRRYESLSDLLMDLDGPLCKRLWLEVLPRLSLLDPACGSGAFLVAAMKVLINIYGAVIGRIKLVGDRELNGRLAQIEREHPSLAYYIKKRIITDNLFGVDVMEEATEIARLRLFLALVASAREVSDLEPLPNIDFNIQAGNSLIGLMRIDESSFDRRLHQGNLFRKNYRQIVEEKNRLIDNYRNATEYSEDLTALRDDIAEKKQTACEALDDMLLDEFKELGIKFEQATWDEKKHDLGRPIKRPLKPGDIDSLRPFHWGFEFDEILNGRGGFDAIITNPPWETFKPYAKEFFDEHSSLISKNNMTILDFEAEQAKLLMDRTIRSAWLEYLSGFPFQSSYFRSSPQYCNQISIIKGKRAGTDINLYKLFVEQCFNLLRTGGHCGMVIPAGIYNDLGTSQLRELLFSRCRLGPLFGFSNERYLFEGVHHSVKMCVLDFVKDGTTIEFGAAFRINPREAIGPDRIERFLHSPDERVVLSVPLIRRLSPDSLSVMEFKSALEVHIAEELMEHPLLGQQPEDDWSARFSREFDMTNDSYLFKTSPARGRLPLFEGKLINQFVQRTIEPKYWINEREGRAALLGREKDEGQKLAYQDYRLAFRDVARNTDSRTAIMTMLPPRVFCNHPLPYVVVTGAGLSEYDYERALVLCAIVNSFVADYILRQRVTAHLTFFILGQLPMPRLAKTDPDFAAVLQRSARLICTSAEFDELARMVGLKDHRDGVTEPSDRARLRAELDGLIAQLYGLTEAEFAHVLSTFPVVPDPVKVAAQNAYRDVERGLIQ